MDDVRIRYELAFEDLRWNDMRRYGPAYAKAALEKQVGAPILNYGAPATYQSLNSKGNSFFILEAITFSLNKIIVFLAITHLNGNIVQWIESRVHGGINDNFLIIMRELYRFRVEIHHKFND